MSSMFCDKIYRCINADWCARDFNPNSETPECFETMTKADRVRKMGDEELAETFAEIADCVVCETMMNADCRLHHGKSSCLDCWLDFLRKEVT